jgi:hypothetical protein
MLFVVLYETCLLWDNVLCETCLLWDNVLCWTIPTVEIFYAIWDIG